MIDIHVLLLQKFRSSNLATMTFSSRDFQIGGKCNNAKRKKRNKQTVYLGLVTGFSDSSSDTSDDSDGNWKRRKRMDGNEVKQK